MKSALTCVALAALVAGAGIISCYSPSGVGSPGGAPEEGVVTSLSAARATGRPVLLFFGGPWCPYCVGFESQVLADPEVQETLEEFVVVKVDPRSPWPDRAALRRKTTGYVPEILVLAPDLSLIGPLEAREPRAAERELREALAKIEARKG